MGRSVFLSGFVLLTVACSIVTAQVAVARGVVRGVVSDDSGAVITSASVELISRSSGQSLSRTSNSAGIFVLPSQPVGLYALEVSVPGFRREIVEPVHVQIGQTASVNVHLQPGPATEAITVSGESPLLRTEDSNQSSVGLAAQSGCINRPRP